MTYPRELVLVGGGHSHVQVLRMQRSRPLEARLTLVVDRPLAAYSGMVPGVVAGQYRPEQAQIDVRPLARQAGVRVVHARCTGVDVEQGRVRLEGRPPLAYDLLSFNVGSTIAGRDLPGVSEHAVPTRPIQRFVQRFEELAARDPRHLVIVGAGAGGVELAFCVQARLGCRITVVARELLPRRPGLHARIREAAEERGVSWEIPARVARVEAWGVELEDGRRVEADGVLWVAGAAPHPGLFEGLPQDEAGFVLVEDSLQVVGHPELFAVGDCASLRDQPWVPKAGVYAVREGPVLLDNLHRVLGGEAPLPFRAQRDFLTLLNLGDGTALGEKWGQAIQGAWVFGLKDRIDRDFMKRFQVLGASGEELPGFREGMPPMSELEMVCGGCAAKLGETALGRALERVGRVDDPQVVLGLDGPEDAHALQRPGEVMVQSVDLFPAFTDEPWLVGQVAAANALSDLHATGVVPRVALAMVTLPRDAEPEEALFQALSGVRAHLDAEGCSLIGGHTSLGEDLVVGLSVTGFVNDKSLLWTNEGARVGDTLVLSRALGTGLLFHADMAGRASGPHVLAALAGMVRGNGPAARALRGLDGVHAVTDVTGFGLGGHLIELLRGSQVSARLHLASLPALPGVLGLLERGERSSFHEQNRALLRVISVDGGLAGRAELELLFDPQTAGGLLVAASPRAVPALLEALRRAGDEDACVIGEVTEQGVAAFSVE